MSGFFDHLQTQLIDAARARRAGPSPQAAASEREPADHRRSPRWRSREPRRPWLLALVVGVLVATGTAIAAVSIGGQRSQPLSGVVPHGQQPHTALVAGKRYTVGFAPSIQAGQIGWCVSTRTFSRNGHVGDGGTGGCNTPAATAGAPVLGTSTITNGGGLSYVFATANVAAIKIAGGPTVLTRPSTRLPDGYRAAIFEYEPPGGLIGLARIPGGGSLVTPLAASGKVIAQDASGPPVEPARSWLYPNAPAAGSCSLSPRPATGLRAGSGSVVTSLFAAPSVIGSAFLPCVTRDLYLPRASDHPGASAGLGTYLVGAVLLDASHPGAPPGPLPDLRPVPGRHGLYDSPSADVFAGNSTHGLTAERIPGAWLVVAGGASRAQRIAALDDLVPELHLADQPAPSGTPRAALCQITYRPIAGLQETTTSAITTTRRLAPTFTADSARTQLALIAAQGKLRRDEHANPRNRAAIASDQATISLLQQATFDTIQQSGDLFAPSCAQAAFYDAQRWPMTATVILATKDCPGQRRPIPCSEKAAADGAQLTKYVTRVTGHPHEFSVPATAFVHPAETVEQIDKWWLVIDGGASLQQRQRLLNQLQAIVSPKLRATLRHTTASPATFCARQAPTTC
jgi:hypothetical protein